jgi:hypothetical protein
VLNPLTHRKILKKGLAGRATIIEIGALDRGATSFNLPMTLQVHVPGITPYEVEDQWMVKARDTAALSGSIPVKVDPEEHDRVAIDWDTLRDEYEGEKQARRDSLAQGGAPTAGGPFAGAWAGGGDWAGAGEVPSVTPVIDMRSDPELRAKIEAVLGRTLTPGSTETVAANDPALQMRIMQVVQEHMAQKAGGMPTAPMPPAAPSGDDRLARLERLAALKASGALTDAEFEAEKAKILAGP